MFFVIKKDKFEFWKSIAEIVISVVSVYLVLLTLFEMQADRDAAYMPDISISDANVAITWETAVQEEPIEDVSSTEPSEDSFSQLYNSLSETYDFNTPIVLQLFNIGVGTAKDIMLEWDHEANISAFTKAFSCYDDVHIGLDGNMLYVQSPSLTFGQGVGNERIAEFMLSSSVESKNIQFPYAYSFLINELLSRKPIDESFPKLSLVITYSDIQNKMYIKEITISTENILYAPGKDGTGLCLYNLHIIEESNTLTAGSRNIGNSTLLAISAVATFICIICMIFCIINSFRLKKHNRNRVRPVVEIKLHDTEDNRIGVDLANVGDAPLMITSLKLNRLDRTEKEFIKVMSEFEQICLSHTEELNGRIIPANGYITLIAFHPTTNELKSQVRDALSEVTVLVDYTDLYSTIFTETVLLRYL